MKKPKVQNETDLSDEMWINPKSNIKGDRGNRAFDDRLGVPSSARYLELADQALGFKKPAPKKKKAAAAAASAHQKSEKTEPYSS
jgi:hypothetical protein